MNREEARGAIQAARRCAHRGAYPAYYLLNAGNWIVRALLEEHKNQIGLPAHYPMSDAERLEFELSLLNETARARAEEMIREQKENEHACV